MENGETVIGMLHHVIIGLRYWSHECTLSWTSDNGEEYTEVTEKYQRKLRTKRSVPSHFQSMSLFVICSILQPYALLTISLYVYVFLCINTPVCCMYFTSLNINLATYFSKLALICLKLLLGLTMDSPTLSRPPRFEASIKRVVQPTS